jgi:uncharacterized protein YdeI (BOF family)
MKKLILIAVMAIFSSGVFAADAKNSENEPKKVEQEKNAKSETKLIDKQKVCFDDYYVVSSCGIYLHYGRKCFSDNKWLGIVQYVTLVSELEALCP